MRWADLLGRADVIVYDALCTPSLLKLAPSGAEIIFGGKRAAAHAIPQEQLNQLLVDKAHEGKTVVRLKGGDPFVFGRGGEEAEEQVPPSREDLQRASLLRLSEQGASPLLWVLWQREAPERIPVRSA